jgi:hypothetical protein
MNKKIINIILIASILILIVLDALALHDIFVCEQDITNELAMTLVSIPAFAAIYFYFKQRKLKSTQH